MKQILRSDKAPEPVGPYSIGVKTGKLIFLSGQIAPNAQGEHKTAAETRAILETLKNIVESWGLSLEHIVKVTLFLKNMGDFGVVNEVYASYFKHNPPARSCVEVSALPKGALVEIEVIVETAD